MGLKSRVMVKIIQTQFWLLVLGLCLALCQLSEASPIEANTTLRASTTAKANTPIGANTPIKANTTIRPNITAKTTSIVKTTTPDSCGSYATCNKKDAEEVCYLDNENSCIRKYPSECHLRVDLCHMKQPVPEFDNDMCSMDTYFCEIGYERWTIFFGHEND